MLCAEEEASVTEIARQVTTHSDLSLETDIVVVRSGGEFVGVLPTRTLMEAIAERDTREARERDHDGQRARPGASPAAPGQLSPRARRKRAYRHRCPSAVTARFAEA